MADVVVAPPQPAVRTVTFADLPPPYVPQRTVIPPEDILKLQSAARNAAWRSAAVQTTTASQERRRKTTICAAVVLIVIAAIAVGAVLWHHMHKTPPDLMPLVPPAPQPTPVPPPTGGASARPAAAPLAAPAFMMQQQAQQRFPSAPADPFGASPFQFPPAVAALQQDTAAAAPMSGWGASLPPLIPTPADFYRQPQQPAPYYAASAGPSHVPVSRAAAAPPCASCSGSRSASPAPYE